MRAIRVLIVDDAPEVRQGLRTLLPLAGEAASLALEIVGEAGSGGEAVEGALALDPDVVLMDLEMPGMDGCAATRAIKEHRPSTRVVFLTVHGDVIARRRAKEAGGDDFVEKGAPMDALLSVVYGRLPQNLKGGLP